MQMLSLGEGVGSLVRGLWRLLLLEHSLMAAAAAAVAVEKFLGMRRRVGRVCMGGFQKQW